MKKDIFIDNNIANKFGNPMDEEYKKLVKWLLQPDILLEKEAQSHLAVSNKLLSEYNRSNIHPKSMTAIPMIVAKLQRESRLNFIENSDIAAFKKKHFTKKVVKKLTSNEEDRTLIPVVLLSDRKMALSNDVNFSNDLMKITGFQPIVASRPKDLDYE